MHDYKYLFILLFFCTTLQAFGQLDVRPERATATYELGEVGHFSITNTAAAVVHYTIFHDAKTKPIETGKIQFVPNMPNLIPFEAKEAGVYLCEVESEGAKALASIAFAPHKIGIYEPEPADFDAFWDAAKQELASIPVDPQMTFFDTYEDRTRYIISVATVDNRRVHGYLTVPNATGTYPAIVTLPPFGTAANVAIPEGYLSVQANSIALSISIHNSELDEVDPNAYQPDVLNDADNLYYKNALLACVRAIDFIFTLDQFDGENLVVNGVSQGGGLAIMTAGIDERVKVMALSNAAMCQHSGFKYDKASGFPFYLHNASGSNIDQEEAIAATSYLDAVYFAKRYAGPVYATISYEDVICPAATVFAAYNQFRGPKMLVASINLGHDTPNDYWIDRVPYFRHFIPSMETPSLPWLAGKGYLAEAGNSQIIAIDTPLALTGNVSFNSVENTTWEVQWEKIDGAGVVTFSDAGKRQTTATFSKAGTYTLRFAVHNDDFIQSEEQRFIIEDFVTIVVE